MEQLDAETKASIMIRNDEYCADLPLDVMKQFAYLRASRIILQAFFDTEPVPPDVVAFAIHLANEGVRESTGKAS